MEKETARLPGDQGGETDPRRHRDDSIAARLKNYYDSIVDEGTPAHLLDLLERLHEAEQKASKSD